MKSLWLSVLLAVTSGTAVRAGTGSADPSCYGVVRTTGFWSNKPWLYELAARAEVKVSKFVTWTLYKVGIAQAPHGSDEFILSRDGVTYCEGTPVEVGGRFGTLMAVHGQQLALPEGFNSYSDSIHRVLGFFDIKDAVIVVKIDGGYEAYRPVFVHMETTWLEYPPLATKDPPVVLKTGDDISDCHEHSGGVEAIFASPFDRNQSVLRVNFGGGGKLVKFGELCKALPADRQMTVSVHDGSGKRTVGVVTMFKGDSEAVVRLLDGKTTVASRERISPATN